MSNNKLLNLRPMLAATLSCEALIFPKLASNKLDGVRAIIVDGVCMSRSMKPIPNLFIQEWASKYAKVLEGFDGELIVGEANAHDVFNKSVSSIMRKEGKPEFTFWAFDNWKIGGDYQKRYQSLYIERNIAHTLVLPQVLVNNNMELYIFEEKAVSEGYEGIVLRAPNSIYKYGRSTLKEGGMLKLKRFCDAEAVIIGFEEELANYNLEFKNEMGYTKRSSHQKNKLGKGSLGALAVCGINTFTGIKFHIGSGFTAQQRLELWEKRNLLVGKLVTFKYFPSGLLTAPRHPVFKGFRDTIDMETTGDLNE